MSWGVMLFHAQEFFSRGWWRAIFRGLALFLTTLSLNLVGDGLDGALNLRLREHVVRRGLPHTRS